MRDRFFDQKKCDRCGKELTAKTMSWFTNETICMECSDKESIIKKQLRLRGVGDAMEGCGYIPEIGGEK